MQQNNEMVSFIVPVYNMEALVQKSIDSIISQTYTNIEIIVIDDGSTDNSGSICDTLAQSDDRIHVIHQANKGIAGATNTGLDNVHGDYIIFVDSDDYIDPEMTERLINVSKLYSADIAQCAQYTFFNISGIPVEKQPKDIITVYESKSKILEEFFHGHSMGCNFAEKLFKVELFSGIRCEEGMQFVDIVTIPRILIKCNKYVHLSGAYYYCYKSPNSITRGLFNERKWNNHLYVEEFLNKFISLNCPEYLDYYWCRSLFSSLNAFEKVYRNKQIGDKKHKLAITRKMFLDNYKNAIGTQIYLTKSSGDKLRVKLFRMSDKIYIIYIILKNMSMNPILGNGLHKRKVKSL